VQAEHLGNWRPLWETLLRPGHLSLGSHIEIFFAYPVLPWLGILMFGYGLGPIWRMEVTTRRRLLASLGFAFVLLWVLLRGFNIYGDPRPWTAQSTGLNSFLKILDCQKYPPSLCYTLMTIGPALLLLAWWDCPAGPVTRHLLDFGRVPLFFYLLHVPLIHGLAVFWAWLRSVDPSNFGYDLPGVYIAWIVVLAVLYPLCRWYSGVKARHPGGLLSYL
jgi:uncharacterized membrane protein